MKRLLALTALALVALSGCSSPPEPLPESTYFELMAGLDSYENVPNENLADLGEGFCGVRDIAADAGTGQELAELEYLDMATEMGFAAEDVGAFFVYATATYCPEHATGELEEMLKR